MADFNVLDLLGITDPMAQSQGSALADAIRGKRAIAALGAIGSPAMQALGAQYAKDAESESELMQRTAGQRAQMGQQRALAGITDAMHRAQLAEQARHNKVAEAQAAQRIDQDSWRSTPDALGGVTLHNTKTGEMRGRLPGAQGVVGAKMTESQGKAFSAVSRMREARKQMEAAGYPTGLGGRKDAWATGASGGAMSTITPQEAASEEGQRYFTAARNLIAALLRKESGAAITKDEWEQLGPLYVPMPWDSTESRAQKLKMLDIMEESAVVESGPSGASVLASKSKGSQAPENDPLGIR